METCHSIQENALVQVLSQCVPMDLVESCLSFGHRHVEPNWDEMIYKAMFVHYWIDMLCDYSDLKSFNHEWISFSQEQMKNDEIYRKSNARSRGDTFYNYFYFSAYKSTLPECRLMKELDNDDINFKKCTRTFDLIKNPQQGDLDLLKR